MIKRELMKHRWNKCESWTRLSLKYGWLGKNHVLVQVVRISEMMLVLWGAIWHSSERVLARAQSGLPESAPPRVALMSCRLDLLTWWLNALDQRARCSAHKSAPGWGVWDDPAPLTFPKMCNKTMIPMYIRQISMTVYGCNLRPSASSVRNVSEFP